MSPKIRNTTSIGGCFTDSLSAKYTSVSTYTRPKKKITRKTYKREIPARPFLCIHFSRAPNAIVSYRSISTLLVPGTRRIGVHTSNGRLHAIISDASMRRSYSGTSPSSSMPDSYRLPSLCDSDPMLFRKDCANASKSPLLS